jgi:anaerobic magnesium-protoporphyrin IX monomethyl ester cyclase
MALDVAVIIPLEPELGKLTDPQQRQTTVAQLQGPLTQGLHALEDYVGRTLRIGHPDSALVFGDTLWPHAPGGLGGQRTRRSLSAITLATHLEAAGLRWRVIDPCTQTLGWWRARFIELAQDPPRCVAVCTTFVVSQPWVATLCALIRRHLPTTRLLVGGYFYAVNVKNFLALDADVLCTGEGEERLPRLVRALRDGEAIDDIPGLYIRQPDGQLRYTGRPEALTLNTLPFVDWRLSARIEPPIALEDVSSTAVETQRGCVFTCEFCDYRTIALPNIMTAERAAAAILSAAQGTRGGVRVTDATATFPHRRWEQIMDVLIAAGGCPVPIWCYARVSDLQDDRLVEKMARAGVRHVFIGQESGDQRMLNKMRKGTLVSHVGPAVAAMARHGICATFSFLHGFPGDNAASIQATRDLIVGLNDGFESAPPALHYIIQPLQVIDFANIARDERLDGVSHPLGYHDAEVTPAQAVQATYDTFVAASRVPHGPCAMVAPGDASASWEDALFFSPHRFVLHRWAKTIERGAALFMRRAVEGVPLPEAELASIRAELRALYPERRGLESLRAKARARLFGRVVRRVTHECREERAQGPGPVSRAVVSASALWDTGSLQFAGRALQAASYPSLGEAGLPANLSAARDLLIDEGFGKEQAERRKRAARALRPG